MNWTIGVSGTLDKTVAFARNEREPYGLKDPLRDLPSQLSATTKNARFHVTGDTNPVDHPLDLFFPLPRATPGRRKLRAY